ncbi:hypothetical protein DV735_g276, partial [Chaetothyriales sp. CBS 134920]
MALQPEAHLVEAPEAERIGIVVAGAHLQAKESEISSRTAADREMAGGSVNMTEAEPALSLTALIDETEAGIETLARLVTTTSDQEISRQGEVSWASLLPEGQALQWWVGRPNPISIQAGVHPLLQHLVLRATPDVMLKEATIWAQEPIREGGICHHPLPTKALSPHPLPHLVALIMAHRLLSPLPLRASTSQHLASQYL